MKQNILNEVNEIRKMMGLINEQKEGDTTLTLDNIGEKYKKLVFPQTEYRGLLNRENLKGTIVMTSEESRMNKSNNWNRPERIKVDFSSAEKLEITPELEEYAKRENQVLGNPLKLDYNPIVFIPVRGGMDLLGKELKPNSIVIKCVQGKDDLFIFKSPDDKWKYLNITYK